jgi:hypothetical protein
MPIFSLEKTGKKTKKQKFDKKVSVFKGWVEDSPAVLK